MKKIIFMLPILAIPFAAKAEPNVTSLIDNNLKEEIAKIVNNDIVITSINFQNKKHEDLTEDGVIKLDNLWRKQREEDDKYFISAVLSNPLSAYLTRVQAHSKGKFLEIFVMDNKGLNVGQSSVSSDFWQGDEAKWQKTYQKGSGAVFIDEPELNKDNNIWAAQYNIAITDPRTSKVIGAATVEINLTELERLKGNNGDE